MLSDEKRLICIYGVNSSLCNYSWHCISLHHNAWHVELCRRLIAATISVQHRVLGIMTQLHTLLSMKAGDMALCIAFAFMVLLVFYGIYLTMVVRSGSSPRFGDGLLLFTHEVVGVDFIINFSWRGFAC